MKKDFMEMLKKEYNGWLVVSIPEAQDYNGEIIDNFFIFTENEVLTTSKNNKETYAAYSKIEEMNKVRKATSLHLQYSELKGIVDRLKDDRKEKLEKVLASIEPKYNEFNKLMQQRSECIWNLEKQNL